MRRFTDICCVPSTALVPISQGNPLSLNFKMMPLTCQAAAMSQKLYQSHVLRITQPRSDLVRMRLADFQCCVRARAASCVVRTQQQIFQRGILLSFRQATIPRTFSRHFRSSVHHCSHEHHKIAKLCSPGSHVVVRLRVSSLGYRSLLSERDQAQQGHIRDQCNSLIDLDSCFVSPAPLWSLQAIITSRPY